MSVCLSVLCMWVGGWVSGVGGWIGEWMGLSVGLSASLPACMSVRVRACVCKRSDCAWSLHLLCLLGVVSVDLRSDLPAGFTCPTRMLIAHAVAYVDSLQESRQRRRERLAHVAVVGLGGDRNAARLGRRLWARGEVRIRPLEL